jgi:AcrR family transcriptional regulator
LIVPLSSTASRNTRRPYHHGNLREALIQAGLEVIAESGVKSLTLREIGSRVGVSRMAAYRHFADKAALLGAIGEAGFTRFADALEAASKGRKSHYIRLEEMGVAYVRFAMAHRAHFEVMFGANGEPQNLSESGKQVAERSFLILLDLIKEGQQAGKFTASDPLLMARTVWATVHGISLLRLEPDPDGDAAFTRASIQLLKAGIQPRT